MNFTKIGNGFIHESKKGNKSIHLILDPQAKKDLMEHDWERGIFIFKSKKLTKNNQPFYTVMVSMPDEYEYSSGKGFNEKEVKETMF